MLTHYKPALTFLWPMMTSNFGKPRPLQEWKISLFTAAFFPLLLWLGFWQLQRAAQKDLLLAEYDSRQHAPPLDFTALSSMPFDELRYRQVKITGEFDPEKIFLLENRTHDFQRGVEVIGVFHAADGQHFLVNRGWLPEHSGETPSPPLPTAGAAQIMGDIYVPEAPFAAGGWSVNSRWPKRVPVLDFQKIASLGGDNFFPAIIRLAATSPAAITPNWEVVVTMTPLKHRAYAVQWFTLAAVLLALYMAAIARKTTENGAAA